MGLNGNIKNDIMIKLCVTGCLGSGKSTVCDTFKSVGIPVFNCDLESRRLLYENADKIISIFGKEVLQDGKLDRSLLGKLVFDNKDELKKLTDILHPLVHEEMEKFYEKYKSEPLCVVENAILFETGGEKKFDYILTVAADEEIRIQRAMQRDNLSREEIMMKINHQLSQEYKVKNSDFVVYNNENRMNLNMQVADIYDIIIKSKKK